MAIDCSNGVRDDIHNLRESTDCRMRPKLVLVECFPIRLHNQALHNV